MARKVFLILLALVLTLSVGLVACVSPVEEEQLSISDLKGPDWMKYVGTVVTVEGIFVRDPIPMLLTDLDIVLVNNSMPEDQYIILIGDQAENIHPEEYGGAKLKLTGEVVAMDDQANYRDEHVGIQVIHWEFLEMTERYYISLVEVPIEHQIVHPNRYAILFSGGNNTAENRLRYWNDLKFMYSTLINRYGYAPEHIKVLYADGSPAKDPVTGLDDTSMPVDGSATEANLHWVFNLLKATTTPEDFIFVFTTNHGGGFCGHHCLCHYVGGQVDTNGDEPDTDVISETLSGHDFNGDGVITGSVSWDEALTTWGGAISDDRFSNMFTDLKYQRMVIVMEQCFSGGFIFDMAGSNRIIISAATEDEFSWGMCPHSLYEKVKPFDEFSYYFTCAVNGADEQGNTVDADINNDGQVSMVEAFNYAVSKDTQNEWPCYEDNGDGVPHSVSVPQGGDGTLGSNTFL